MRALNIIYSSMYLESMQIILREAFVLTKLGKGIFPSGEFLWNSPEGKRSAEDRAVAEWKMSINRPAAGG